MRVAVKSLYKKGNYMDTFKKEVELMHRLESPHTPKLLGISSDKDGQPCIVMELLPGGDLKEHLERLRQQLSATHTVESMLPFALQIAKGLAYLHGHKIIHRDLKPNNILLSNDKTTVKIGDFGVSRQASIEAMTNNVGTALWMAPEVVLTRKYSIAADVFALGVILTQLNTLQTDPYADRKLKGMALVFNIAKEGLRPSMPSTCPVWYRDLATACMSAKPSQPSRPGPSRS
ncbi:TKL protein kinase [Saprolegnia diclina VS20]|uniref:TKL protein kinase n=1 Tax=Saprolegnia diclina (strain VS20) TaxID=1156394 RepID=T0R781_SAPDV|nr:TKL protein kinase [Saprolegnia diclina VS20]EQC42315.1 TKL protein kinase [Saprolegnia diclina VS20]|eukprot:XP_008603738.1 TKL protein kinase [Saprolegnia diclina VS20]